MTQWELLDCRQSYVQLVEWLINRGHPVTSRGLTTRERTGVTLTLRTPNTDEAFMLPVGVNRGINLRLAAVEALQLIGGGSYPDLISAAAPTFNDVLVSPENPDFGAYGPRVAPQFGHVVDLLRADPGTRRAVATIWRETDLTHNGDRPCTLTLQFLIRNERLELHVNMRSQDVWLGVPYDLFMFTQLQLTLARQLDVKAGNYVHHVGSLHMYERDIPLAALLTDPIGPPTTPLPRGVVGVDDAWLPHVADSLLGNDDYDTDVDANRNANPWYAAQIDKLRTTT